MTPRLRGFLATALLAALLGLAATALYWVLDWLFGERLGEVRVSMIWALLTLGALGFAWLLEKG